MRRSKSNPAAHGSSARPHGFSATVSVSTYGKKPSTAVLAGKAARRTSSAAKAAVQANARELSSPVKRVASIRCQTATTVVVAATRAPKTKFAIAESAPHRAAERTRLLVGGAVLIGTLTLSTAVPVIPSVVSAKFAAAAPARTTAAEIHRLFVMVSASTQKAIPCTAALASRSAPKDSSVARESAKKPVKIPKKPLALEDASNSLRT